MEEEKSDKNVEFLVVDTTAFIENAPLQEAPEAPQVKKPPNWEMVTSEFFDSVSTLKLGELLHVDSFTLSEAMTAIEMMDPKLDLGMTPNRSKKLLASFDKAVEANLLKLDNFTEEELSGIMDFILSSFVSCIEGCVETNLYLQKPGSILDKTLQTFCLCLQEMLKVIKEVVERASVYDDDFQLLHCEYTFSADIAEDELIDKFSELGEQSPAVGARVNFIRILYQILLFLLDEQPKLLPECEILLGNASEQLIIIKATIQRGFYMEVFEDLKLKPEAAVRYLETLLISLKTVGKISEVKEYYAALNFFKEFSKTNPCTLSRSVLQLLYPGSNTITMKTNPYVLQELLRDDSRIFVGSTTPQAKFYIDTFLSLCIAPFGSLLKLNGVNQTRQRDKISLLLQEFIVLQGEAQKIDAIIVCFSKQFVASFSTWILYHTLQLMVLYLFKGFELELYSVHEYYYIYWYLSEFLYSWLKSAIMKTNVLANSLVANTSVANSAAGASRTKSKRNRKNKNDPRIVNVHQEIVYYHAIQNMCGGYYQALLGFVIDKKIRLPCSEFSSEEIRYNHRFEPFHNLGIPPFIQYSKFLEKADTSQLNDSTVQYRIGCDHFSSARQLLETLDPNNEEQRTLLKICKSNCIVLRLLIDGYKKNSTVEPEFNFTLHKCFPTIKFP